MVICSLFFGPISQTKAQSFEGHINAETPRLRAYNRGSLNSLALRTLRLRIQRVTHHFA